MKNALVTGGTRGIGLSISKMLLKEGYFTTITYSSNSASANKADNELRNISPNYKILRIDQGKKEDLKQLVEYLKGLKHLDCLICNAGMTLRKRLIDITDEDWEHIMQVNLNSYVYLLRDLFPIFPNNSRIIFIGSLMAIYPHSTSLAYGVTKAALHALSKNLLKSFENTQTTINTIAPGFVETEWQKDKPQDIRNNIYNKTAIKRFANTEEIANAVKFCINNSFVNGAIIEVSGGYSFK